MDFSNKVVLITGAGSGIGAETARLFAKLGASVALVDRNEEGLTAVATEIKSAGLTAPLAIHADVTIDAKRIIDETIDRFGKLDVLVNNAGIVRRVSILDIDMDLYDEIQNINARSVVVLLKHAIPHLEKTKGNVVNLLSLAAIHPASDVFAYCMSKAALGMLTMCMAGDLGPKGIRVNAVIPGAVATPIYKTSGLSDEMIEKSIALLVKNSAVGRFGLPSEIAAAISYLASDQAGYITGTLLKIDGGLSVKSMG